MKMYEGNTTHPTGELFSHVQNAISSGENILNSINTDVDKEFNEKCAEYVANDPILVKYFEGFIDRLGGGVTDIYNINYYGVPVEEDK